MEVRLQRSTGLHAAVNAARSSWARAREIVSSVAAVIGYLILPISPDLELQASDFEIERVDPDREPNCRRLAGERQTAGDEEST